MAAMLAFLKVSLSWREILRRTFSEAFLKDNCLGMAAQLAYYFFFALFPALLFLVALASYFPAQELLDDLFRTLGGYIPPEALSIITDQLLKISEGEEGGLLTIGVLTALWSTSTAMTAIIDTLNQAYDIEEGRSWWQVRLTAVGLTTSLAVFILSAVALLLIGPDVVERLLGARFGSAFEVTWNILRWPLIFALVSTAVATVYYFAPDADQDWVWLTPGSIFATALWVVTALGFRLYIVNMGSYTETYGAIGGVMVLMLWFYLSGLVVLIGAEMNAEIEHASPYGKDEGEKVPGERRKIGAARMRAWLDRQRRGGKPPSAEEVKEAVGPAPPDLRPPGSKERDGGIQSTPDMPPPRSRPEPGTAAAGGFSSWLIGAVVVAAQVWFAARSFARRRKA